MEEINCAGARHIRDSSCAGARRLSGDSGGHDLWYLFLFWIAAYVAAFLAQKTRLSPLLFYLLFGALFINLNIIEHTPFLNVMAEVAITLVFFALGFEESVGNFLGGIRKAWGIATIGAIVPFCCGFGCALGFWPELGVKPALMCGLAVTATAVSLTMIALKSEGLALSRAAIGIMTSAVLDDVACLCLVAILVPIATGEAEPSVEGIGWILGKCAMFFFMIIMFNVFVFPHDLTAMPIVEHIPLVRSLGVNTFVRFQHGEQAVLATLAVGLGIGLLAKAFGFHPAIGAYMAGLVLEERYFDLVSLMDLPDDATEAKIENVYHHVKDVLENAAFCWLGPVFFIHLGAQIEIEMDIVQNVIVESLLIFVALFFGQVISAGLAARFVPGGFTWQESIMIGFGMLGRAELFFVVLNICYIDNAIFTTEMFYSLTFAAMLLNISVPITISLYKPYYTGDKVCCLQSTAASVDESDNVSSSLSASWTASQAGWLHRKAMKSYRQQARRIYHVDTDLDLSAHINESSFDQAARRIYRINAGAFTVEGGLGDLGASPVHQTSKDEYVLREVCPQSPCSPLQVSGDPPPLPLSPMAALALPAAQNSQDSFGRGQISKDSYPQLLATGCGVKGCCRSTCVICKHINTTLTQALASTHDDFVRLAYEDEKDDLAAMDHGRPTLHEEIHRTVSEPEIQIPGPDQDLGDLPQHQISSATISGATGRELAREVRQYIEAHDSDGMVRTHSGLSANGNRKSAHGRNVALTMVSESSNVGDSHAAPRNLSELFAHEVKMSI